MVRTRASVRAATAEAQMDSKREYVNFADPQAESSAQAQARAQAEATRATSLRPKTPPPPLERNPPTAPRAHFLGANPLPTEHVSYNENGSGHSNTGFARANERNGSAPGDVGGIKANANGAAGASSTHWDPRAFGFSGFGGYDRPFEPQGFAQGMPTSDRNNGYAYDGFDASAHPGSAGHGNRRGQFPRGRNRRFNPYGTSRGSRRRRGPQTSEERIDQARRRYSRYYCLSARCGMTGVRDCCDLLPRLKWLKGDLQELVSNAGGRTFSLEDGRIDVTNLPREMDILAEALIMVHDVGMMWYTPYHGLTPRQLALIGSYNGWNHYLSVRGLSQALTRKPYLRVCRILVPGNEGPGTGTGDRRFEPRQWPGPGAAAPPPRPMTPPAVRAARAAGNAAYPGVRVNVSRSPKKKKKKGKNRGGTNMNATPLGEARRTQNQAAGASLFERLGMDPDAPPGISAEGHRILLQDYGGWHDFLARHGFQSWIPRQVELAKRRLEQEIARRSSAAGQGAAARAGEALAQDVDGGAGGMVVRDGELPPGLCEEATKIIEGYEGWHAFVEAYALPAQVNAARVETLNVLARFKHFPRSDAPKKERDDFRRHLGTHY